MPRPIWSGSISFGLVNVPIRLVSATADRDVHFHQLHAADGVRIRQKRVCPEHGEEVPFSDIVKGYDLGDGRYVVVTPDELDALDPVATRTIDIEEFVDLDDIDPVFYEHPYWLVPDERAAKPYALLVQAMERSRKVALGRFVMRTKQYLAALRAADGALLLSTMRFADEVVGAEELDGVPSADQLEVGERELAMAEQLIATLSSDEFDPTRYRDEHRERVRELIDRKAAGEEVVAAVPAAPAAPVVDLVAALEASLAAAAQKRPA